MKNSLLFILLAFGSSCQKNQIETTTDRLERIPYVSETDQTDREYYLYVPEGYDHQPDRKWPVILFLHGNGERGNGKDELGFTLGHGPLYEAWVQKRKLPFLIISPQLHLFGLDTMGISYLMDRKIENYPKRIEEGTPKRGQRFETNFPMEGSLSSENDKYESFGPMRGWEKVEQDLLNMLDQVKTNYNVDDKRIYLSGLSYGGFGTWYLASKHPTLFAAINPIVGWGDKRLMRPIAQHKVPVWCFAGGRDLGIESKYFYPGLNELERLGHPNVRFTIEADMGHDTWTRVYAGEDLYRWFLSNQLD